jgi:choline dehydrogenase
MITDVERVSAMSASSFDYIVIGAGAAGCVLANRLSEDSRTNVLLLEAGGSDFSPFVRIPAGFGKLMGTKANWIFDTVPQRHLNDRRMFLPQGRLLGGSTAVNAMLYVRGNRLDYDGWRDLGNEGWGYDDVLPYFNKSENNERIADEYHGTGGPLNVADQIQHNPLSKAFVRASQEVGIPFTADPNGASQEGVFYHQVTQRNARRESAASAFLWPAKRRGNLTVLTGATVTKIILRSGRAVGLSYVQAGKEKTAYAGTEVIISSGAINSPRLLMLSGIGPAAELEQAGVHVVHDLPGVGKNLQDQLEVYVTAESRYPISYSGEDRWHRAVFHALQYGLYRTGPATATVTEAGAFVSSDDSVPSPDLQLHFLPAYVVWEDGARTAARIKGHGFTILACNVRPRSTGDVRLVSSNPRIMPAVDPDYLADPHDWEVTIEGFHRIRKVLSAPAFKPHLSREHMPGADVKTDEDIRAYIRKWAKTDYHPVGTCKMGSDELAVVDARLRVHGIDGLRVIDSSIMPKIISGNTQAPSIMIGEKGAAMVLSDAGT